MVRPARQAGAVCRVMFTATAGRCQEVVQPLGNLIKAQRAVVQVTSCCLTLRCTRSATAGFALGWPDGFAGQAQHPRWERPRTPLLSDRFGGTCWSASGRKLPLAGLRSRRSRTGRNPTSAPKWTRHSQEDAANVRFQHRLTFDGESRPAATSLKRLIANIACGSPEYREPKRTLDDASHRAESPHAQNGSVRASVADLFMVPLIDCMSATRRLTLGGRNWHPCL
jgi:hypothetical protein